jgi:hypothetical protein
VRLRIVLAAGVALLLGAAAAALAPASEAATNEPATVTAVGWWTLATGVPKAAGGLQVAQDPTGSDMSVGAIKIKVNESKLASVLVVLNEASTSNRAKGAGMFACTTTTSWTPANPGLWTDVPDRDCSHKVQMVRSEVQQAWSANLLPLLGGKTGEVGVMFVPGAPPPGSIEIPTIDGLPVTLPSLPVPVVGGVPIPPPLPVDIPIPESIAFPVQTGYTIDISNVQLAALADTGLGGLSPVDEVPALAGPDFSTPSFDDGSLVTPPLDASTATAPTVPAADDEQALVAVPVSSAPGKPWGRLFALVPLAIVVGAAGAVIRRLASAMR